MWDAVVYIVDDAFKPLGDTFIVNVSNSLAVFKYLFLYLWYNVQSMTL